MTRYYNNTPRTDALEVRVGVLERALVEGRISASEARSAFANLPATDASPLYRAPLRHIGGKNYAPYETSAGDALIAVVQPDGGSWLTYSFTNWNAISSSLQHVELHSQAVSSVPVYGIFERAQG